MSESDKKNTRPKTVKEFFRSRFFWKPLTGVLAGGMIGFMYFYFIGCTSGSCPITSHPVSSMVVGGLAGLLVTI